MTGGHNLKAYFRADLTAAVARYVDKSASEPLSGYTTERKEEIGVSTRYTAAPVSGLKVDIHKQDQDVSGLANNLDAFKPRCMGMTALGCWAVRSGGALVPPAKQLETAAASTPSRLFLRHQDSSTRGDRGPEGTSTGCCASSRTARLLRRDPLSPRQVVSGAGVPRPSWRYHPSAHGRA